MPARDERAGVRTRLWIPFAIYAAVTCVVPLARRADRHPGFWEHAAMTLLLSGTVVLVWIAIRRARMGLGAGVRRGRRSRRARMRDREAGVRRTVEHVP